jgi:hypothetical protein
MRAQKMQVHQYTDNVDTVERHGNCEYGICEYTKSCIEEVKYMLNDIPITERPM